MAADLPTVPADDRQMLVWWARVAVASAARGERLVCPEAAGLLARPAAVFVSLHRAGVLRGCMGSVSPSARLLDAVVRAATAAASDPRFDAIGHDELDTLEVQISVLGPIESVADIRDIELGVHGIILEQHGRQGLFLPQVAVEQGWDREILLQQVCVKAGIPPTALHDGARLFRFSAQVFGE